MDRFILLSVHDAETVFFAAALTPQSRRSRVSCSTMVSANATKEPSFIRQFNIQHYDHI